MIVFIVVFLQISFFSLLLLLFIFGEREKHVKQQLSTSDMIQYKVISYIIINCRSFVAVDVYFDTMLIVQCMCVCYVSVPSLVDSIKCVLIVMRLHSVCLVEEKKNWNALERWLLLIEQ